MNVLMLSLDSTLLTEPGGNARKRHLDYAERCGRLTIIVRSPHHIRQPIAASDTLTLIPSASRHPAFYPWDVQRPGRALTEVDLIVTQDQFTSGLAGVWLRPKLRAPLLVQNHSTLFDNPAWLAEKPLRNRVLLTLARWVRAQADFVRTVNQRESAAAIAAGIPADRVEALALGTVSSSFRTSPDPAKVSALRSRLGLSPEQPIILWVGYPVGFKRVPLLLEVFRRVAHANSEARLLLVGDLTRSIEDLRALAGTLGIGGKVVMTGGVPHDSLPTYYALANVYALTSSYEGVPRVLMEAASAGLPIAAMRAPGVDEIVQDGVSGCLVDDGDTAAMAEQILALLRDYVLAKRLADHARMLAHERYDADSYAERWVALWKRASSLGMRP